MTDTLPLGSTAGRPSGDPARPGSLSRRQADRNLCPCGWDRRERDHGTIHHGRVCHRDFATLAAYRDHLTVRDGSGCVDGTA